ncbi:MAG TPA: hypothetical protein VFG43_12440 [Geminicoccaceae bacterium]|nr:hypothetical protein [Geminicoccaceae bacterium]
MRTLAIAVFGIAMLVGSSAFAACDYHTAKSGDTIASTDQKAPTTKIPPPTRGS